MADFDLLVIGAGSGGVRAARMAAATGAKVAVVENGPLGGTCVNLGCVPKKLMMYAAHFAEFAYLAAASDWSVNVGKHSWPDFLQRKNAEISRLNGIYRKLLQGAGVRIIHGTARFTAPKTVQVDENSYSAHNILIAVGSTPTLPDIEGANRAMTSDDVFHLPQMPKSIVIVGGGFIATEFACILHGLGVKVTQLYRGNLILRGFDAPGRQLLVEQMRGRGIDVLQNVALQRIVGSGPGHRAEFSIHGEARHVDAEAVMFATGRRPNLTALRLENAGVSLDARGYVAVDTQLKTNVDGIYALGDVIGRVGLTPVAINEAMQLVNQLFGDQSLAALDYDMIPQAVFATPALARVGPTAEQLNDRGVDYVSYTAQFTPMMFAFTETPMKDTNHYRLLVDKQSGKVLAAHLLGRDAPEIMQILAVAIKAGATKADFDAVVGIHPTSAEELVTIRTAD